MDALKAQAKALVGAVIAALGGVALTTATDPDGRLLNPELPNTTAEWVTFVITVLATYLGVYASDNRESVPDLQAKLAIAQTRVADGKQGK
jgi:hypothetical protein